MFLNFNKKSKKFNEKKESKIDKNLRMMTMSGLVLVLLFAYTLIRSDTAVLNGSYYLGIIFLFILMGVAFYLQKYKDKLRDYIPDNKFKEELQKSEARQSTNTTNTDTKEQSSTIASVTSGITFKDVAGISDVKAELEEVVDFLNNPKKYSKHGVFLPKGVLLVGPPGVGKTLIARAVAGEADVPFFYQSGASFVHIYVGMGAKRVRELFNLAKAQAPSIIFIDEIDAVGKQRGVGANDEREATLNELLTQMDGFEGNSGVMVIGATNKIDVLDEALLRAGRFDRRVFLTLPSREDREQILELYLRGKKYNFELEKLATDTSGFSSSALATLINESLLNMIKRDGTSIVEEDIQIAKNKIQFGKKQVHLLSNKEKDILATYQATKAFITRKKVLLLEEGVGCDDLHYPSKTQLEKQITNLLSGSVGVFILLNEEYIVFESEINQAYNIANDMVNKYRLITNKDSLIEEIKTSLVEIINSNKDEILTIKQTLLKDEVVVF